MSLILSGSEGLSDVDGTAATPAIRGTDTNTGIFFPAADTIAFAEGGVESMRLDSSGNLGVGTGSPKTRLQSTASANLNAPSLGSATNAPFYLTNTDTAYGLLVGTSAADGRVWLQAQRTDGTATAYNITLNEAGGNVGIGTSSLSNGVRTVIQGSQTGGAPQTSGTTQTFGLLRLQGTSFTSALDFGTNGGNYAWIQSTDQTNLATNYSLALNPNGGNVGIGTSSPSGRLDVEVASAVLYTNLSATSGGAASVLSLLGGSSSEQAICYNSNALRFGTVTGKNGAGFTERVRIDGSGNFYVGTTSLNPSQGFSFDRNTNSYQMIGHANGTVSGSWYIAFNYNSSQIGTIAQNGTTAVSYNTTSDYRLKHDVQPITGALARVAALKPVTYKWNADDSEGEGFIAHELAEVCPQAVTGEKDAVDADGNPKYQGIDTSFLVATLTAAIQELKAELDAVKTELAALKGTA